MPEKDRKRLVRPLSNGSINKTIRLLAVVLEQAVEYGYLERNPAKGRKRLLKEDKPTRSYLQPDQVAALLSAAGKIDADAREGDTRRRRPLLATLTLAGLRISEALDLRWRDVNLDARRLRVATAKTDAGVREVDLTPALQELLADYRSRSPYTQPGDLVFPTSAGKRDNPLQRPQPLLGCGGCQRPSVSPQRRPSKLPTDGHVFSPPAATVSPRLSPSIAAAQRRP